jgi:hypothetical protein
MKKLLLSSLVFAFILPVMAQNSVNLRMNLEKNKVYRLRSVSEQTVTQTINGNQQSVDSKVNYTISLKMIDATKDFMITEVHFDTLVTNTNSMGKLITISSLNEGDLKSSEMGDIMSCIMNRLSKNAVYVKMDYTGRPVEVVNAKMLSDLILKDTSTITLKGIMRQTVKAQAVNAISDNSLKTMISMFTWFLPGKEVAAGEDWKVTQQSSSGGMSLDIVTSYHLVAVNGNMATVAAESSIHAAENALPIESGGAKVTYDNLQGLSKANMKIDLTTGLISSDEAKSHIAGNLGITAPGLTMQMPMDINGQTKVRALQ